MIGIYTVDHNKFTLVSTWLSIINLKFLQQQLDWETRVNSLLVFSVELVKLVVIISCCSGLGQAHVHIRSNNDLVAHRSRRLGWLVREYQSTLKIARVDPTVQSVPSHLHVGAVKALHLVLINISSSGANMYSSFRFGPLTDLCLLTLPSEWL